MDLQDLPNGWSKRDNKLYFALKCQDFKHAIAILNSFADIANQLDHHPDLGVRDYNEVFVSTTTHDAGDVTSRDYELAREISNLVEYQAEKQRIELHGRDLPS